MGWHSLFLDGFSSFNHFLGEKMAEPTKAGYYWVKIKEGEEDEPGIQIHPMNQEKWVVVYYEGKDWPTGEKVLFPVSEIGSDCGYEATKYIRWISIPEP